MNPHILIAAGGTGGHVIPAQVVAEQLQDHNIIVSFAASGLSSNSFFDGKRWTFNEVSSASPSVRRPISSLSSLVRGTAQSFRHIRTITPSLVIGFGSYHTVPILAAAALLKIPTVLYAADAVPGRVVRCFAPMARWTGCFFAEAASKLRGTTHVLDLPLRSIFSNVLPKEEARTFFGLPSHLPTILILGGSQGSKALNELVPRAMEGFKGQISVLHLCGHLADQKHIQKLYLQQGIVAHVLPYESRMHYAFSAADVVIARSGASAIAEIEAFSLPALYIPYPYAMDDHQRKNAELAARRGTAIVVSEAEAGVENIAVHVRRLLATTPKKCKDAGGTRPSFVTKVLQTLNEVSPCLKK